MTTTFEFDDVGAWRAEVTDELRSRLPRAFRIEWSDETESGVHSLLILRHPVLVEFSVSFQRLDDPSTVAQQTARNPYIVEAANSPYQSGPIPETVHDLPADVRAEMAAEARGGGAGRLAASWHEAVERADFDVYEPDTDQYRWTGGFNGLCTQIGVCGLVGAHITRVETWANVPGIDDEILAKVSTIQLEGRHGAESGGEPPDVAAMLEPDERLIVIGDATYRCGGRRLKGVSGLWTGHIAIDAVRVQISTTSPAETIALRICADAHALTRTPPRRR